MMETFWNAVIYFGLLVYFKRDMQIFHIYCMYNVSTFDHNYWGHCKLKKVMVNIFKTYPFEPLKEAPFQVKLSIQSGFMLWNTGAGKTVFPKHCQQT